VNSGAKSRLIPEVRFFKVAIQERVRLSRATISATSKETTEEGLEGPGQCLKLRHLCEMIVRKSDKKVSLTCYGLIPSPTRAGLHIPRCRVRIVPPLGILDHRAARLMLALLEYNVAKEGGTYAMEDTDSWQLSPPSTEALFLGPGGMVATERSDQGAVMEDGQRDIGCFH